MAPPNNPRIRVREATPADIDAIVDIHFAAFDDNVMNQLMYPGGPSTDAREKFGANLVSQLALEGSAGGAAKSGQPLICVAEYMSDATPSGPGEVVAFAKWLLHRQPRTEEEWKGEAFNATKETWGEGCDTAIVNAFIGEMTRIQRDHAQGEAALFLGILACRTTRQRLGAGSALLRWGVDLADSLALPCRLEASPVGYGLYRKFGYEDLDVLDLKVTETWGVTNNDGSNWGAKNAIPLAGPAPDGVLRSVIMRRPAKNAVVQEHSGVDADVSG